MAGFFPGNVDSRLAHITLYAAGFDDPTVTPVAGRIGTVYVKVGTASLWQKQDEGTTTNWLPISGAALSAAVPRVFYASSFNANPGDGTQDNPFQSLQAAVDAVNAAAIAEAGHRTNKRFVICVHPDSRFDEDIDVPAALQLTIWSKGPWTLGDAALADMASTTPRNIVLHVDQDVEDLDGVPQNRPAFNIVSANRGVASSTHPGYTMNATISGDLIINDGSEGNPNSNTEMNLDGVRIEGNLDGTANPSNLPLNCFFHSVFIGGFYNVPLGFLIRVVDSELHAVVCSDYSYLGRSEIDSIDVDNSSGLGVPPLGFFDCSFKAGFVFTRTGGTADLYMDETSQASYAAAGGSLAGGASIVKTDVDENETASNVGGFSQVFLTKVGLDLQFRTMQSSDARITISQNANDLDFTMDTSKAPYSGGANRVLFYNSGGSLSESADCLYDDANANFLLNSANTVTNSSVLFSGGNNNTVDQTNNALIVGDGIQVTLANQSLISGLSSGPGNFLVNQAANSIFGGQDHQITNNSDFAFCIGVGNTLNAADSGMTGGSGNTLTSVSNGMTCGNNNQVINGSSSCSVSGQNNVVDNCNQSVISGDGNTPLNTGNVCIVGNAINYDASTGAAFGASHNITNSSNMLVSGHSNVADNTHEGVITGGSNTLSNNCNQAVWGGQTNIYDNCGKGFYNGQNNNMLNSNVSVCVGDSMDLDQVDFSVVMGTNHLTFFADRSFINGDSHQTDGSVNGVGINNSVMVGSSHLVDGAAAGFNVSSSVVAGDSYNFQNSINRCILAGDGQAIVQGSAQHALIIGFGLTFSNLNDSIAFGNSGSYTNCSDSLLGDGTYLDCSQVMANQSGGNVVASNRSVMTGNSHVVGTTSAMDDCMLMGSQNTPNVANNSCIAGNFNVIDGANACLIGGENNDIDSCVGSCIVGDGSITVQANSSLIGGNANTYNVSVSASMVVGENHDFNTTSSGASSVCGNAHNMSDMTNAILGGDGNVVAGVRNFLMVGQGNTVSRDDSIVCGDSHTSDGQALISAAAGGTVMFEADDDGLVKRDQGGLRVKTRVDGGAVVSVNARTDYFVRCTNGALITLNLPAGVDGMEYILKTDGATTATVTPNGADTIDGAATLALGLLGGVHLIFAAGDWSVV